MKQVLVLLFTIFIFSGIPTVRAADPVTTAPAIGAVEKRITELHTKLQITADQETLWATVAQEMRDDEKAFHDAIQTREGKAASMTAIEDLNSYADMTALHASSMKKFVTVFTPLYTAMGADQKKNADTVFQEHKKSKKRAAKS